MITRILTLILAVALVGALAACASPDAEPGTGDTDTGELPADENPDVGAPGDPALGLRLANGIYDMEDGTVQVLGTLEYRDLEGGMYVIIGAPEDPEGVIAVVNNPDAFADELVRFEGLTVSITGTRFDGVSIRMAGPEVVVETIAEISDTPDLAE